MSYRDDDDPFEEDIVFDQAGLLSTSRKSSKSAIRRVSSGKCAMFSKTLGLCGAFLGLGLTFAIPGPLSPVPPDVLSKDVSLMTYEVMYRCQGFMIGAMFGARLLDRFNRLFLVFLALLVTALLVTIIPWCGIVWLLRIDMFLLGVSLGFLTTGGNVLCLDLWGRNSGPFMQALHLSFSLGVFLAPFLSQPLMTPINYSVATPSTTPAMFLHERLPRDVGNFSAVGSAMLATSEPLLRPTANHPLDFSSNKSLAVNSSTPSASLVPVVPPTANLKPTSQDLKAAESRNSSLANTTQSAITRTISLQTSTVLPPASASHGMASSSSSETSKSIISSTVSSLVSINTSESLSTSKIISSTTTHRPKPIMVNSAKLPDGEAGKFRNPPPEDLLPVSTTMKPMFRPTNQTASSVSLMSTSTQSSVANLTLAPNGSVNISNMPSTLNTNHTSIVVPSSTAPSLSTSSISVTSVEAKATSRTKSSSNTSIVQIPSTASTIISSKIVTSDRANATGSSSSAMPIADVVDSATAAPQKNKTSSDTLLKSGKPTYGKGMNLNEFEKTETAALNFSTFYKSSEGTSNSSKEEHHIGGNKKESALSASSSAGKGDLIGDTLAKPGRPENSAEVTLGSTARPKQEKGKATTPPSLQPQVRKSTPPPHLIVKPEKSPAVTQGSFGGSHIKTISEAKPNPATVKEHGSQPNHAFTEPIAKQRFVPAVKYDHGDVHPSVSSTPPAVKNLSSVAEDPSKHQTQHNHHRKPDSTVVNDTEVSHSHGVMESLANHLEKYGLSRMELMYLAVGMVLLATSFLFLGFLCFNPRDPKSKTDEEEMNGHVARNGSRSRANGGQHSILPSRCLRHILIGLMLLLLMVTSGVQAMYGQLLMVFAIQPPLQLAQSTGTALTATFWGALTSTRFACILLASALSPTAMLVLSVAICSCATWLLSAFASSSEAALWIGSVMVSVGTASVFPSGMLWMQRHVLITHRVAAMLVMGPAMGEMFFPTLAYKMMVSMGPASLIHLPALLSLFAIALWAATWRLARYPRQSLCSHVDESSGYQLANQHDEDDLLDLTMSPIVNGGGGAISRNSIRSSASAHSVHRMSA